MKLINKMDDIVCLSATSNRHSALFLSNHCSVLYNLFTFTCGSFFFPIESHSFIIFPAEKWLIVFTSNISREKKYFDKIKYFPEKWNIF